MTIREQLRRAAERAAALPSHARPLVVRPWVTAIALDAEKPRMPME